jgi:hypothetical protein
MHTGQIFPSHEHLDRSVAEFECAGQFDPLKSRTTGSWMCRAEDRFSCHDDGVLVVLSRAILQARRSTRWTPEVELMSEGFQCESWPSDTMYAARRLPGSS